MRSSTRHWAAAGWISFSPVLRRNGSTGGLPHHRMLYLSDWEGKLLIASACTVIRAFRASKMRGRGTKYVPAYMVCCASLMTVGSYPNPLYVV